MKKIIVLLFIIFTAVTMASSANSTANVEKSDLSGDWVAQINIPQNELTIILSLNFLDGESCIVTSKWIGDNGMSEVDSGIAKYILKNNKLIIDFINEDERIRTENVFEMHNVYDVKMVKGQLVIFNSRQFRNVDVYFGKGYANRGYCEIIFPD